MADDMEKARLKAEAEAPKARVMPGKAQPPQAAASGKKNKKPGTENFTAVAPPKPGEAGEKPRKKKKAG